MQALTICQPYAELILRGAKLVENRTWWPPVQLIGQRFAIHSGKSRKWLGNCQAEWGIDPETLRKRNVTLIPRERA